MKNRSNTLSTGVKSAMVPGLLNALLSLGDISLKFDFLVIESSLYDVITGT